MKRFVVPPTWPSPPRRSWVPPKTWRPDPSWPPAPEGWRFWVDGKGKPVRGPIGRYGGPSRRVMYAGAGALVLFLGVNIWAVSALGLFGGDSGDPQAVQVVDDSTPTPSGDATSPVVPADRLDAAAGAEDDGDADQKPTQRPTQQPTQDQDHRAPDRRAAGPDADQDDHGEEDPQAAHEHEHAADAEEISRQYCVQQGWDPEWCDPDNWPRGPGRRPPQRSLSPVVPVDSSGASAPHC